VIKTTYSREREHKSPVRSWRLTLATFRITSILLVAITMLFPAGDVVSAVLVSQLQPRSQRVQHLPVQSLIEQ